MEFFGTVAQLNLLDFHVLSMMDGGSKIAVEESNKVKPPIVSFMTRRGFADFVKAVFIRP